MLKSNQKSVFKFIHFLIIILISQKIWTIFLAILLLYCMCRPDTLDPALLRPGRLDRKVEFGLPDLESRTQIFKIHTRTMNCERDIRFELLSRLCPNSTGLCPFLLLLYHTVAVWKPVRKEKVGN
jgi:hypothetical protein